MKRKEILKTLHKIKWDGKLSKLPQLSKLLKNALVSPKIDPAIVLDYLLTENATFKYINMCQDSNDDFLLENCDLEVVQKLIESFQPILETLSHPFIEETLGLDISCLDIILSYMCRKYVEVVEKFNRLNNNANNAKKLTEQLNFDKNSIHTMKLVAEVATYHIATCIRLGKDEVSDELALFPMNTFMELVSKVDYSAMNTSKRRSIASSVPRMHVYIVVALRLYVALLSQINSFSLNITSCINLYHLLRKVTSTIDVKFVNCYLDRYVYVPLTILSIQIMICCWSCSSTLQILQTQEDDSLRVLDRRRSKTISIIAEQIDMLAMQQINIIYIADCARYIVNYLGKIYTTCSDFRLRNVETSINQFMSILMLIYNSYVSNTYLLNISFDGMRCGFKNRYIHFCFGAAALAGKKYVLSRSSLESLMDFNAWDDDGEGCDHLQISSALLLLSNYINNTGQIDKAIGVIEKQILPYQQQIPVYTAALVYLSYSLCCVYKARYMVLCEDNRDTLLKQALEHINHAYSLDDGNGEIVLYKAFINAKLGQIDDAFDDIESALQLLPDDPRPYQLKALLYCCEKEYHKAFQLVSHAFAQFTTNINLLYLKIKLLRYNNQESTLQSTFLEFNELIQYIDRYLSNCLIASVGITTGGGGGGVGIGSGSYEINDERPSNISKSFHRKPRSNIDHENYTRFNATAISHNNIYIDDHVKCAYINDAKDSIDPLSVESIKDIKFNLYFAIWEVAYELQSDVWLDLFHQVIAMFPQRPESIYMQELVNFKNESKDYTVSEHFRQYLALYPRHPRLVSLYLKILGKQLNHHASCGGGGDSSTEEFSMKEAELLNSMEYYAKVIVEVDEFNYKSWKILGETLYKLKRYDEATNVLSTALQIETIQPIVSFDTVPLIFCPSDY